MARKLLLLFDALEFPAVDVTIGEGHALVPANRSLLLTKLCSFTWRDRSGPDALMDAVLLLLLGDNNRFLMLSVYLTVWLRFRHTCRK